LRDGKFTEIMELMVDTTGLLYIGLVCACVKNKFASGVLAGPVRLRVVWSQNQKCVVLE
jgi:hypothetical protein